MFAHLLGFWIRLCCFSTEWMRPSYFLIRFTQMKTTLFIFVKNWVIRENKSFLLVEPCSNVTCCVEINLQYFFRKYILIWTIYTLLMQHFLAILFDMCRVHGGSNSWEKPTASGTKMEQWSVTLLPIGKPRAVDNTASMFCVWHFKSSVCVCWAVIGTDATKAIFNVTINKIIKC